MPHTVTGRFDDGSAYQVLVTGAANRPVIGSVRAAALVELFTGRLMLLTPTGPIREVAGADEATVLAVLRTCTNVLAEGVGAPRPAQASGA